MSDHNKEIRSLTESANNLYANNLNEQGGWPGGFQNIPNILRGLIERYYFLEWLRENPDDPWVTAMKYICRGNEQCMYDLWVKAGKPMPAPDPPTPTPPSKHVPIRNPSIPTPGGPKE